MPALARQVAPDHYDDYSVVTQPSPPANRRWQEEKSAPRKRTGHRSRVAPDSDDVQDLLSHFGHGATARESHVREQLDESRAQRRAARRRHRPFRVSATAIALSAAPLGLLASLLWLRSSSLSMARRDTQLQNQINASRFDMEHTRQEIAAMNASPHIEAWAKERKWQRANQQDFDQIPAEEVTPANADVESS